MSDEKPLIGIDLGGTNIQIGIVSAEGDVLSRAKRKTEADEGRDAVLGRVVSGIEDCCKDIGITLEDIGAAGIGVPGPVDDRAGVVVEAVNLRWVNEPVGSILSEKLGMPVTLENDVNVAIYGEWKKGAGRGATDLLGAWVGTGVGGAFILNNELYRGHFQSAGEIGHMIIEPENPPGARSLEHNCSRTAICNRLRYLIEANRPSIVASLVDGKLNKIKSKVVADAYSRGDELTVEVVHDAADRLGVTLGSLVTALSLQRIVLGGGLTEAIGEIWVEQVRAAIHRVVFPVPTRAVEVVATELADNAGVIGAAMLARLKAGASDEAAVTTS